MIDAKNTTTPLPRPLTDAESQVERRPLSGRRLVAAALLGLVVLGTVSTVMWLWINTTPATSEQKTTAHLEVFKTTGSVAVMLGGLGALYLAARRQRTQEAEHNHAVRTAEINRKHAERVAAATEDDAARRRVTELYAKAADQLGSDKAPVRLAGLYALERVGQDNPNQRQTIINLLCAYPRMPYEEPLPVGRIPRDPHDDLVRQKVEAQRLRWEEREVRLTAQRIVFDHLELVAPDGDNSMSWGVYPLDLRGAVLLDLDLRGRRVGAAQFGDAHFIGPTLFSKACFTERAVFAHAGFGGTARFTDTRFVGDARFPSTHFAKTSSFARTRFEGVAEFRGAVFCGDPALGQADFARSHRLNLTNAKIEFDLQGAGAQWVPVDSPYPSGWTEVAEELVKKDRWRVVTLGRAHTSIESVDDTTA
ncbi:pentapeptide repeat-containing protein [Amycolatopsis carbonis]|uniref:Pentapeptide repeat-containing protein n=1 Tax=Amycolatopsis carbonis TaxID=715471 RepID=A0A9Y2MVJ6_9PSEU|nr:pentapeptide repeat-containing protein [Amycolatopsis sp. 2-15]WIX76797.1 pentapeptide repeat-containing protein [Amycolatopsis sp. 2-15]